MNGRIRPRGNIFGSLGNQGNIHGHLSPGGGGPPVEQADIIITRDGREITATATQDAGTVSSGVKTATTMIPDEYIIPSGVYTATTNGDYTVTTLTGFTVAVPDPDVDELNITPTESAQSFVAASYSLYGFDEVNVSAIPSNYVGSAITTRTSLIGADNVITALSGYYAENATFTMPNAYITPTTFSRTKGTTYRVTFTKNVESAGYVTTRSLGTYMDLTLQTVTATPTTGTQTVTPSGLGYYLDKVVIDPIPSEYIVPSGVYTATSNTTSTDITNYKYLDVAVPATTPNLTNLTITPTETTTTYTHSGYDGYDQVTVNPIPSQYVVPTGTYTATTSTTSVDISSYQYLNVNVPVGIDLPTFTATLDGGGEHITNITCDKTFAECLALALDDQTVAVLDVEGYLNGLSVTDLQIGGYVRYFIGINGHNLTIEIYSGGSISFTEEIIPQRDSSDLTVSGATVNVPAGLYESNASKSVASGSVAVTATTATATPSISVSTAGVITASVSGTKSVGATVTTGYVSSASSGTVTITGSTTSSLTTTAGTHITPTTTAQTAVPAYRYTTGSVIVDAIPSQYIVPSGTYTASANTSSADITNYKYLDVSVSGGGKNAQIAYGFNRVAGTAYTAVTGQSITVSKTGTYHVYWSGWRSSTSGTNGTQLYIGNTAYGTANTSFDSTYTNIQDIHLTNVSLTQGQTITVRARSRGNSYYMYVFNLTIIEA